MAWACCCLLLLLLVVVRGGRAGAERPRDGEDTVVHVAVVQGGEEAGRHVERTPAAAGAEVGDLGGLGVAVLVVGDGDGLTAVSTAGPLGSVHGDDEVRARVGPTTGTCCEENRLGRRCDRGQLLCRAVRTTMQARRMVLTKTSGVVGGLAARALGKRGGGGASGGEGDSETLEAIMVKEG